MFTGIVDRMGTVVEIRKEKQQTEFTISFKPWDDALTKGESIAVSGICLTVVRMSKNTFTVQAIPETLRDTTAGEWRVGGKVNLERSLRLGDRMGGHFVFGHVDGMGTLAKRSKRGENYQLRIAAPGGIIRYLTRKGSIAIDGISFTVQKKLANSFEVGVIPHTWTATTIGGKKAGDSINLEVDMLAKQVRDFLLESKVIKR